MQAMIGISGRFYFVLLFVVKKTEKNAFNCGKIASAKIFQETKRPKTFFFASLKRNNNKKKFISNLTFRQLSPVVKIRCLMFVDCFCF